MPLKLSKGQKVSHRVMDALREEASEQGMSFEQIASKAGLDRSTVSRSLRKERNPSLWVTSDIAEALGVSLPKLIEKAESEL